jgi:hypothetical protein
MPTHRAEARAHWDWIEAPGANLTPHLGLMRAWTVVLPVDSYNVQSASLEGRDDLHA